MARIITKELALKIVDKLKAKKMATKNKAHDEYLVTYGEIQVAIISIRRGSEKDKGHDYIPKDIHVSTGAAKKLGQCPMSRDQYFDHLKAAGVIPEDAEE